MSCMRGGEWQETVLGVGMLNEEVRCVFFVVVCCCVVVVETDLNRVHTYQLRYSYYVTLRSVPYLSTDRFSFIMEV
jgi:hypothetical protein